MVRIKRKTKLVLTDPGVLGEAPTHFSAPQTTGTGPAVALLGHGERVLLPVANAQLLVHGVLTARN